MTLKSYILMFSLLCSLLSGMAAAGNHADKNGLTLDEAVAKIREQTDGRILSAKTVHHNGKRIHQIRVLTKDGRVQRFQVEAKLKDIPSPSKRQH